MKQVSAYFKDYSLSNQCFTTSEGFVFHEKGNANLHAQSLQDKKVETHKRENENPNAQNTGKAREPAKVPKVGKTAKASKASKLTAKDAVRK